MALTKSVTFSGTAAARAQTTLVSKRIDRPFRLLRITARFPPGCANLVTLEPWSSPDADAPTSGNPTGVNLLQDYSQAAPIRGDAVEVVLPHEQEVPDAGTHLKVVCTNLDWYDHNIDVDFQILLDPPPGGPYAT